MASEFKTVLIAGSTGMLGDKITHAFLDKNQFDVRVLVRKANEKTEKQKAKGATVIEVDFNDHEALKKATTGVDAVVSVLSGEGIALQPKLIEAAAATGVKRFIPSEFGSSSVLFPRGLCPEMSEPKYASREDLIEKLGLSYTYIITNAFMDYLFSPFFGTNIAEHKVTNYGPDVVFSAIHTDDIAQLVPEILLNPNTKNTLVNLATETFKWNDVIAQLEKLTGKTFTKNEVNLDALDAYIKNTKPMEFMERFVATWQRQVVIHKGGALSPIHNLTDPFYANVKPKVTLHDYIVLNTKH